MGAQSSKANREQPDLPFNIEKLHPYREQITDNIARVLRRHLLDNMGELGSARTVPAVSNQFVDLFCRHIAADIEEADWTEQIRTLAQRGLAPKTAVALIDTLYDELQTRLGDKEEVIAFARGYRSKFLDAYMQARQNIVVTDHESIHKSLTLTLETRLNEERELRAALEQERAVALRRAEALAAVAQINSEIAAITDEKTLLQTAVTLTNEHFQLYHTHIYLLDDTGEQLVLAASAGEAAAQLLEQNHAIPVNHEESLVARAARTRQPLVVRDTRAGTGFLPNPLLHQTRSAVAAPLLVRGQLFGILNAQASRPGYFTEDDVHIQASLAAQIAAALYNVRAVEQTQLLTNSLERQLEEINTLQRAMTHQGWQAFMTAKERPIQGYKFTQDNLTPLSPQELVGEEWPSLPPASAQTGNGDAAVLPIIARDVAVGALAVRRPSGEPLNSEQHRLLADISYAVAEALERARLFEEAELSREQAEQALAEAQRRTEELAIINKIVTKLGGALDMQTAMQIVADGLAEALGVEQVRVTLLDENKENLVIMAEHHNPDKTESALGLKIPLAGNELTQEVMRRRKPVRIADVTRDSRVAPVREILLAQKIKQILVMPMLSGNEVIGTVGIDILEKGRTLTADQVQLAETIVSQAATAVQNSRLFTQIEKRAAELAAINAVSEAASSHLDLATLSAAIGPMLQQTFRTDTLYIAYYNDKTGIIEFPYYHSYEDGLVSQPPRKLDENSGFTGKIIQTRQPLLFIPTTKELEEALEESRRQGAQLTGSGGAVPTSYLGAPMIVGEEIVGVIGMNTHDDMKVFDEADKQLLVTLARTVGVAVQNARSFKEAQERAEELAVINRVAEAAAQQLEISQLFTTVHEQVQRAIVNDTFYFAIYDKKHNRFDFPYFFDEERKYNVPPAPFNPDLELGKVFTSGRPVILNRTPEQQKIKEQEIKKKLLGKGKPPTNVIFVPLKIGAKTLGVLSVQNYRFQAYTEADQDLLNGIANHVAVALENIRLFAETQKRAEQERLVNEISRKIQRTTSVEGALQVAVQELGKAFGAKQTVAQLSLASSQKSGNGANGSTQMNDKAIKEGSP